MNILHSTHNLPDVEMDKFDYNLPQVSIAMYPKEIRHNSKLLVCDGENSEEDIYLNIANHLPLNANLIFNNTKVIAARIFFKKQTGGIIEIFLLEPANGIQHAVALAEKNTTTWKCLVGGVKKWKNNELIESTLLFEKKIILKASLKSRLEEYCEVEFSWENDNLYFSDIIEKAGKIPLPPYIKRDATEDDSTRYQTVYADKKGSVAAPTAGLHFTEEVFDSFKKKGINHRFITLHVGAGTFKPVSSPTIASHSMHEEYFEVSRHTIEDLADENKMIVAVGTTSLRTIESLYWLGVKQILAGEDTENNMKLLQWEHLDLKKKNEIKKKDAMNALLDTMKKNNQEILFGNTGICITPGYTFNVANALITNFHQPQSTLLLIIAAILGDKWKEIYSNAIKNEFRFLSYGDGSLLFIDQK